MAILLCGRRASRHCQGYTPVNFLEFALKRLNYSVEVAFLLGGGRVAGLDLVGNEVVRPVGGHHYIPKFQLVIPRHPFPFHHFACLHLLRRPA